MKKMFVSALILILILVSLSFAEGNPQETELLFMAKKAYEDGFYEVSLGMLEKLFKNSSGAAQSQEARLLSGQCYFQQGRYLEALNIFEELLNDPACENFKDALYFWMAEVHFKGNNFQKAASLYQKLLNNFPHSAYAPLAYYSLGWSLAQAGEHAQALQAFTTLRQKFPAEPQSKDAAFKLIECLYNLKSYARLESEIKPIFKLYINDGLRLAYLYFYLAESEYYLGNFNAAIKDYLLTVQTFKEESVEALARLGLGWSYLKLAKYKEAEETFGNIKEANLDQKSGDIFILGRAVLMNQTNRVYEAKKLYEQLIKVSGDPLMRMQAYSGKADVLYNLAQYDQAADVYREGLAKVDKTALPPELIDRLRYNLALAYLKGTEISAGAGIMEELLRKSNDQTANVSMLLQIGDAYKEAGEDVKAEEAYLRILKLYSDSTNADYAQYQAGSLQLKRGDYAGAVISFKSILEKYPQSYLLADSFYALGIAYFQKAEYESGIEVLSRFQSAYQDNSWYPQALDLLGNSLLALGKTNEALAVFKDILRLSSLNIELRQKVEFDIADCYYKLGQEEEAFKQFKLLRTKYPDSQLAPEIIWWLGQYYYRAKDLVLARRYFDALIKDFPNHHLSADAFYARGLIYYKLGDYEGAKLDYTKSLEAAQVKNAADIRFNLAEALEANGELDTAIQQYLLSADLYIEDSHLTVLALLRAGKLYEDKENLKEAGEVYKRVIREATPEAKFAQERIDWIDSRK